MKLTDFDYNLPENLIAVHPPEKRGTSRLLVLHRHTGRIEHKRYSDLPSYVNEGDLVVRNNTEVIKARLRVKNPRGGSREILLLESHGTDDRYLHKILHRGKVKAGEKLTIHEHTLSVEDVLGDGEAIIKSETSLYDIAEQYGEIPLPPYMKREATAADNERYQTVFANTAGSVAAPTASLNFTKTIEQSLLRKGASLAEITLHVGLGTFMPIRSTTLEKHKMHSEYFVVPSTTRSSIQSVKSAEKRVIAIGTTVTRTLEYCTKELSNFSEQSIAGEADIFIYPGYKFSVVDALLTNFHAPKSTVLMMAAAFAGWDNLKHAYEEAIAQNYSFLSYGDSMLII